MSTAIHETTSLSLIPDNIGLNYLSEVSLKKKLKAQGFISGSYFSKVVFCKKDQETVDAVGFVYPSQRKRDKPHQAVVTIYLTAKRLDDAHCSCQAGYLYLFFMININIFSNNKNYFIKKEFYERC